VMKITRRQLRRIIKEEIGRSHYRRLRLLREAEPGIVQSHKEVAVLLGKLWNAMGEIGEPGLKQASAAGSPVWDVYSDLSQIMKLVAAYDKLPDDRRNKKRAGLSNAIATHILDIQKSMIDQSLFGNKALFGSENWPLAKMIQSIVGPLEDKMRSLGHTNLAGIADFLLLSGAGRIS